MAASDAPEGFEYVVGPIPIPDGNTRGEYDTYTFVRNLCIIDELGARRVKKETVYVGLPGNF